MLLEIARAQHCSIAQARSLDPQGAHAVFGSQSYALTARGLRGRCRFQDIQKADGIETDAKRQFFFQEIKV